MKYFYFILAWLFVVLGVIGAILPVLPTTPFILLALWAFSKCSVRFHNWLFHHKWFGPSIQRWKKYRVIPLSSKILAVSMMSISLIGIIFFTQHHYAIKIAIILFIGYGAYFTLSKPSRPPEQSE